MPLVAALLLLKVVLSSEALPGRVANTSEARVVRMTNHNGSLERTVYLPPVVHEDEEDDGYVLVSDSSRNQLKEEVRPRKMKRRKKKPVHPETARSDNQTTYKNPKFLNLFTIVKFANDDCGDGGTCYHETECTNLGGTPQGPCAKGFGICCSLETLCGEATDKTSTVFVGGSTHGACSLTVHKKPCTRQIRLDFLQFELEQPVEGNCISDRLLVAGQNLNSYIPVVCGVNTGQHMYVDVDEVEGPIMVSVISPARRDFRIHLRQLCDADPLAAPRNCLQYYTEDSGLIKSFNYMDQTEESTYLNNMNYAVCIRKMKGGCSVIYKNAGGEIEENNFDLRNYDGDGESTVPDGEAGAEIFNCPEDYITVAGVRLCGQRLNDASIESDFSKNAPVTDRSSGPFILNFFTNSATTGRGFRLSYEQKACEF